MDSRKTVFHETALVLAGEALCLSVMLAVFALLDRLDGSVLLGALAGGALAVGNFFFMAVTASLAADMARRRDVASGQKLIRISYVLRLLSLAVLLFAGAKSGYVNILALVLPLLFVSPTITIAEFFRKKGSAQT